jgi:hypothetical protein
VTVYLVFGRYQHTRARLVAYFARFGSGIGDLAMSVDIREGSHGRATNETKFFPEMSKSEWILVTKGHSLRVEVQLTLRCCWRYHVQTHKAS